MRLGGTATLGTGNAVRADVGLRRIGICLDEEFDELAKRIARLIADKLS